MREKCPNNPTRTYCKRSRPVSYFKSELVGRLGTESLPSTIAPSDHPVNLNKMVKIQYTGVVHHSVSCRFCYSALQDGVLEIVLCSSIRRLSPNRTNGVALFKGDLVRYNTAYFLARFVSFQQYVPLTRCWSHESIHILSPNMKVGPLQIA